MKQDPRALQIHPPPRGQRAPCQSPGQLLHSQPWGSPGFAAPSSPLWNISLMESLVEPTRADPWASLQVS
jgi:hypothetical protein